MSEPTLGDLLHLGVAALLTWVVLAWDSRHHARRWEDDE
jgi:hypothetical protein